MHPTPSQPRCINLSSIGTALISYGKGRMAEDESVQVLKEVYEWIHVYLGNI